jgi:hypothetical protein
MTKTLSPTTAIAASSTREILSTQQRLAIAKCAELAAIIEQHTNSETRNFHFIWIVGYC